MNPLQASFYHQNDVIRIAKGLLGKKLVTRIDGDLTSGLIVETEAYSYRERGCHAFNNKMTERNKVMFQNGGIAYVYLCYGIHHLFNVVTNCAGKADAVLIRAVQPLQGEETMLARMKTNSLKGITAGPGKLTKALGIDRKWNGISLDTPDLWIEENLQVSKRDIVTTTRIGIDYAGEDAKLPWRFYLKGNIWVSKL
jgi:DNA-3-methyladenine glycosylase